MHYCQMNRRREQKSSQIQFIIEFQTSFLRMLDHFDLHSILSKILQKYDIFTKQSQKNE